MTRIVFGTEVRSDEWHALDPSDQDGWSCFHFELEPERERVNRSSSKVCLLPTSPNSVPQLLTDVQILARSSNLVLSSTLNLLISSKLKPFCLRYSSSTKN